MSSATLVPSIGHKPPQGRDKAGKFTTGHSAGGRPKTAHFWRELCQDWMSESGWHRLTWIALEAKPSDSVRAIELIAGYAYGKPSQHVDADVRLGGVVVHLPAREEPKVIEHD